MTWLIGYTRRRIKVVNNQVADYQMKLIVHKLGSALDTSTDIYLQGNVKDDFSDIRFTGPDQTTLLGYWIESITGTTPDLVATVWVKVPILTPINNIYIYYDNPSAISLSSGKDTFIVYDDFATGSSEQWTMTGVTSDRTTNHRLNISGVTSLTSAYLDKGSDIGDYEFLYDYVRTSTAGSQGFGVATTDTITSSYNTAVNDGIGAFDHLILNGIQTKWNYPRNNGVQYGTNTSATTSNIHIWASLRRLNDVLIYTGYTDSARTTQLWNTSITITGITNQRYIYAVATMSDNGIAATGWLSGIRIRKLVATEPTFGVSGIEESNITAIDIISDQYTCVSSCSITAGITWRNDGNNSVTLRPAIIIDGITLVYGNTDLTISAGSIGYGLVTTDILPLGTYTICPYPN